MKIGDEVYIHGYIDEIRKDTIIIKNDGGYFGTVQKEISVNPQEPKTGHWITTRTFMHDGEYYCDKCKCDAPNNEKWDYCPNCGARMESEDDK